MSGYQRRLCSNCGEGLGFSESDPCEACQPFVDIVDGLLIPKNQAQSTFDLYRDRRVQTETIRVGTPEAFDGGVRRDGGPDILPAQAHERRPEG